MIINSYDTLIIPETFQNAFEIDVDNDSRPDFRFVSFDQNFGSMAWSHAYGTSINCLHSTATILSYPEIDTLFLNITFDTIIGKEVTIYRRIKYSCVRFDIQDTISEILPQNKAYVRKENQVISKSERFVKDSITMTHASYSSIAMPHYIGPDTTVYWQYIYADQCNTMKNEEVIFFGIKVDSRLGWIKLLIMDNYKILLLETGLENEK